MTLTAYTADGRSKSKGQTFAPNGVVFSAQAAAQSIPNGVWTKRTTWTTIDFDPYAAWDGVNSRYVPKQAGYYRIYAIVPYDSTAGHSGQVRIYKNGNAISFSAGAVNASGLLNGSCAPAVSPIIYCNGTTDYLEIWTYSQGAVNSPAAGVSIELVASSIGVAPEPWHLVGAAGEPAFLNGWANSTNAGSPASPLRFMKDPSGFVHVEGIVLAAANNDVFTLPVGYRPGVQFAQMPVTFWNNSAIAAAIVQIRGTLATSGAFRLYNGASGIPTAGHEYYIGHVFRGEQ